MSPANPVIIPRAQHSISRKLLSPNALRVLYRLRDNGFTAYLVGGCVRDLLLGREPKDFDVVTDATPGQLKRLFRNCRLIGRRFRLAHLHFQDEIIEVATFRSTEADEPEGEALPVTPGNSSAEGERELRRQPRQLKNEDGMVLRDNVFGTPEEDALRRDFTVNALFYNVVDFSIIDYAKGMADLTSGKIRTIGDPTIRFTEDPVRMLRAVRFAAMLGFDVEPGSRQVLLELNATISRAAPPRLYEEVQKLLLLGAGEKTYQMLRQTGLFAALFPHFSSWLDTETDGFPHVRVGQALYWVDIQIGEGNKIQPQLLLTLLFGQYLEEKEERFRLEGAPPQLAIAMAVAEFMGETAPTVHIPQRVGLQIREILAAQQRFGKMPGKRTLSFIGRPGFAAALDYLRFTTSTKGAKSKIVAWWERFILENPTAPPQEGAAESEAEPRRRSRRRRGKKKASPAEPG